MEELKERRTKQHFTRRGRGLDLRCPLTTQTEREMERRRRLTRAELSPNPLRKPDRKAEDERPRRRAGPTGMEESQKQLSERQRKSASHPTHDTRFLPVPKSEVIKETTHPFLVGLGPLPLADNPEAAVHGRRGLVGFVGSV